MKCLTYVFKNLDGDFGGLRSAQAGSRTLHKFILMERLDVLAVVIGPDFELSGGYYHTVIQGLFVREFGVWDVRGGGWLDVLPNGSADAPGMQTLVFHGESTHFGRFDPRLEDNAFLEQVGKELYFERVEVKPW